MTLDSECHSHVSEKFHGLSLIFKVQVYLHTSNEKKRLLSH